MDLSAKGPGNRPDDDAAGGSGEVLPKLPVR
jgi:hypothetical protein